MSSSRVVENHRRFIAHLNKSQDAVWLAAGWLNSRGHNVTVNATNRRKVNEDWKDFTDDGDLHIALRVEVKGLSSDFTCREDWPYGDKFLVCARHSYDRALPKPYGYIIINKAKTHGAIVMGSTHKHWKIEKRTDRRYDGDYTQEFYLCPMEHVVFFEMQSQKEEE